MYDLFLSEFKRYRTLAVVVCVIHCIVWAVSTKFMPFVVPHPFKMMGITFITLIGGVVFGLASTALHKRKNHWTYLVHRPLSARKIYLALMSAGLLLLFIALSLPFLAAIIFLDLFSNNVIELRHYLMALHLFLMAGCAYFIGVYAILSPIKAGLLAIALMQYLAHAVKANGAFDILVDSAFLLFTFYLARSVFQVNLSLQNIDKPKALLSLIALQPAMLLILMSAPSLYYHLPLKLIGQHPQNSAVDFNATTENGIYFQFRRAEPKTQTQFLLQYSEHDETRSLNRQSRLAEFKSLSQADTEPHFSQQLFLKERKERFALNDVEREAQWIFSHDLGIFVGLNMKSDEIIGYFGREGFFDKTDNVSAAQKFNEIPLIVDMRFIQTSRSIYGVDLINKQVSRKFTLPDTEFYTKNVSFVFDRAILMSNKATYFFDAMDFNHARKALQAEHVIDNPIPNTLYDDVSVSEVFNGFLVQYRSYHFGRYETPGAALVYVQHNGKIETIATHTFETKIKPDFIAYQPFILSPIVMNLIDGTLNKAITFASEPAKGQFYFWQRSLPQHVIVYAFLLMSVSALLTLRLLKRSPMPVQFKWVWVGVNFVLSLPGLLALISLLGWRNSVNRFRTNQDLNLANSQAKLPMHAKEQRHV